MIPLKPKVYIDGKDGTTGLQIYERLSAREDITLLLIDEAKRKDAVPGFAPVDDPAVAAKGGE